MARLGILGRLLLIFLSALLTLGAVGLLLLRWQETHPPHGHPGPFLRVRQAAADIDLLAGSAVSTWPAELRALGDQPLRLRLAERPPSVAGLIAAPRLEAKLRTFARTVAAAETRVYTSPDQSHRDPRDGVEGYMARAVAALPDGRYLVAEPVIDLRSGGPVLFGLPTGLWLGVCGAAVATLAVYGAAHETHPLRALARSLDAFDGAAPCAVAEPAGAPDVQALTAAVNAMQQRVAALVRERTLMLGAVSHDLRTLLTRLQLRVLSLGDEDVRQRFANDLEAMRALIDDALAFARGADVGVARRRLDLADLVASEVAEREAVGAPLPIGTHLCDAPVLGDPAALRRVIANLLENASSFGRTRIRVTVEAHGAQVRLAVGDDGPGVPLAERAAVLLPFHRVEGSRSRETGGSGLGLAIAQQIVAAHGGELHIRESELGGAEAQVLLPALRDAPV